MRLFRKPISKNNRKRTKFYNHNQDKKFNLYFRTIRCPLCFKSNAPLLIFDFRVANLGVLPPIFRGKVITKVLLGAFYSQRNFQRQVIQLTYFVNNFYRTVNLDKIISSKNCCQNGACRQCTLRARSELQVFYVTYYFINIDLIGLG